MSYSELSVPERATIQIGHTQGFRAFESADGGSPHAYTPGESIPSTHRWRKVGARIGQPLWVERSKLNAEGQRISTSDALAAWKQFPLQVASDGTKSGYDRLLPASSWNGLPHERKAIDQENVRWWYVTVGDERGEDVAGWVPEKDLITTRHSPWEWEGFDFISETTCAADQLACHLDAERLLAEAEQPDYQAQISTADHGPIKTRLYEIIDGADGSSRDDKLSAREIRAALSKPWHAQSISGLITHYESEWFWKEEKWNELDKLMEQTPENPNASWVAEKARITLVSWWGDVASSLRLDAEGKAWHFHPINLVAMQNLSVTPAFELINAENMKKIFPFSQEPVREEVRELFNKYANLFEINTPERISQFFAQVKAEVGDALVGKEEDLWYSTEALRNQFARYFSHYPQEAEELGYKRIPKQQYDALPVSAKGAYRVIKNYAYSQLPQEDEIAKRIYCCSVPGQNFHLVPGGCAEGLAYKGKGFIQLTWKENYEVVERLLKAKIPSENVNIVADPNQVLETKYGLLTALGFWEWKRLNMKSGNSTVHTDEITKIVNFHTKSYDKRRENFSLIYGILKDVR